MGGGWGMGGREGVMRYGGREMEKRKSERRIRITLIKKKRKYKMRREKDQGMTFRGGTEI